MAGMTDIIASSAEIAENAVLPMLAEVHVDPDCPSGNCEENLPPALQDGGGGKSAARWAYERVLLYIRNFEEQLGAGQEVAMGFAGSDAGVLRIEGLGYFDPDILTFYGRGEDGLRSQIIQHVTQLNVLLRAVPAAAPEDPPRRIGFRLAAGLEDEPAPQIAP